MSQKNKELFMDCLGYRLFCGRLENLDTSGKQTINTINQYSYCIAEEDPEFKESLERCDVLLPDGVGIVYAVRMLEGKRLKKIAGADLHEYNLKRLDKLSGRCFYLGSSQKTLDKIVVRLKTEYPNIEVGTYSPPFKKVFTKKDSDGMIRAVNAFKPDVLFVGMTAPKQEKWVYENGDRLKVARVCSIGAVFDFYAGTVKRPSTIWINLGLEWLGRLLKEPRRMWRRYIYYGIIFLGHMVKRSRVRRTLSS